MRYRLVLKDEDVDLSKMKNWKRWELAKTTKDTNILRKLANDENEDVLNNVAKNPNTPEDILRKLGNDKYYYTRSFVALNPNTPIDLLRKLANDESEYVVDKVKDNPNWNEKLEKEISSLPINKLEAPRRSQLAKTTDDVNILKQLAKDKDKGIRRNIASNPNTSADVLKRLANDKDEYVRANIARNPNTPVNILRKLVNDEDGWVIRCLINNPNCTKDILDKLTEDENWWRRWIVVAELENNTPLDILEKLSKDNNKKVREIVKKFLDRKKGKFKISTDNLNFEILDTSSDGYGSTGGGQFTSIVDLEVNLNGTEGTIEIYGYCNNFDELEETAEEYESETDNSDEAQELLDSLTTENTKWAISEEDIKESVEEFLEDENIKLSENEIYSIVKIIKQNIDKFIKKLFPVNKRLLAKADKLWGRIYR